MRLNELINEGYWKNRQIDMNFDKSSLRQPVKFTVMINGKTWNRNGDPVLFKDYAEALRVANKITANRNIATQVVPLRRKEA